MTDPYAAHSSPEFQADVAADVADVEVEVTEADAEFVAEEDAQRGQYGLYPFTIREVAILGTWFVAFVISFFSFSPAIYVSVWTAGISWVLMIGVPTVATGLIVLRRLSPEGIRRVGSLGIDQFASVAYSVAAMIWFTSVWDAVARMIAGAPVAVNWVIWAELVLMLALVAMTVFGRFIPPFDEDFRGRPETVAHMNARPVVPVIRKPQPEPVVVVAEQWAAPSDAFVASAGAAAASDGYGAAPYAGGYAHEAEQPTAEVQRFDSVPNGAAALVDAPATGPVGGGYARRGSNEFSDSDAAASDAASGASSAIAGGADFGSAGASTHADDQARFGHADTGVTPTFAAQTPTPAAMQQPVSTQPFWALSPVERDVVDEHSGRPLFRVGPTAWALVVVDRGTSFIVRHEDGRVGVLQDISGVTRG